MMKYTYNIVIVITVTSYRYLFNSIIVLINIFFSIYYYLLQTINWFYQQIANIFYTVIDVLYNLRSEHH